MVATSPMASFTESFVSGLKWCSGSTARSNIPSSADPKTQANTKKAVAVELKARISRGCQPYYSNEFASIVLLTTNFLSGDFFAGVGFLLCRPFGLRRQLSLRPRPGDSGAGAQKSTD